MKSQRARSHAIIDRELKGQDRYSGTGRIMSRLLDDVDMIRAAGRSASDRTT